MPAIAASATAGRAERKWPRNLDNIRARNGNHGFFPYYSRGNNFPDPFFCPIPFSVLIPIEPLENDMQSVKVVELILGWHRKLGQPQSGSVKVSQAN